MSEHSYHFSTNNAMSVTYEMSGRGSRGAACDLGHELGDQHLLTVPDLLSPLLAGLRHPLEGRVQPPQPLIHMDWPPGVREAGQRLLVQGEARPRVHSHRV